MIKRIFRSTLFVSLGILFSAILLIMGALYNYFTKVQREQLRTETALIAQGVSLEGKNYFENLNVSNVRITWVDNEGTILYDSNSDATKMDNHQNRKEIREAM